MARRGSVRSSPLARHQSPQALGAAAMAMEPLETPIKDGILYQQHIKFGKVGTLAARQLPRTGGGPLPQPWTAHQNLGEWG